MTGSVRYCRAKLRVQPDHCPSSLPAPVNEELELLAESGVQTAVDERVVAGGAHS